MVYHSSHPVGSVEAAVVPVCLSPLRNIQTSPDDEVNATPTPNTRTCIEILDLNVQVQEQK